MEKIKIIRYNEPVFKSPLTQGFNILFEKFLTTQYAIVEEILYEDKHGTKVGCYNPLTNGRFSTYLESEEVVAEFDKEEAIQYIETQSLLEKERIEKVITELKKHIDNFFQKLYNPNNN